MSFTVVLAYSGGLDTSIIVPWLRETYEAEVICIAADVGQGAELSGLEARAHQQGASALVVEDLRETFVREAIWPTLRAGAIYARADGGLVAARWLRLGLRAIAGAVPQGVQVRFAGNEAALWGRPFLAGLLFVDLGW